MHFIKALSAVTVLMTCCAATASPSANARGETELAKLLAGRVAGQPVSCIQQRAIQSAEVIDGTAIVYRDGNRLYVNRPRNGAASLERDDILLTDTHSSELCSIDVVRLIDRSSRFERGFVGLGQFVPYVRADRD